MYEFIQEVFVKALKNSANDLHNITVSFMTGGTLPYINGQFISPTKQTRSFVESRLEWISSFIDLKFNFVSDNNSEAVIPIAVATSISDNSAVAGSTSASEEDIKLVASKFNISTYNELSQWVWIHELGHSIGLSHPNDETTDKSITGEMTVMSYFPRTEGGTYPTFFTEQDIKNLISIWGPSKDSDSIIGYDTDDILTGTGGHDVIIGNKGRDTLIGGEGADLLIGGKGKDTFVLSDKNRRRGTEIDRINDYEDGEKIIMDGNFKEKRLKLIRQENDTFVTYKGGVVAVIVDYQYDKNQPLIGSSEQLPI